MVFRSPPTIIYGKGTVTSVGEQAARFGKKAVLVCGKGSLRKSGVLDIIVSSLEKAGVSCAVYDRVGSDPTTSDVDEGAAFAKENGCDFIVADFQAVSEYLVVTVPCGFVTVGQMESFSRASRVIAFSSSRWILLPSELFILPKIR